MNTPNPPAQNPVTKKRLRLIREIEPKEAVSPAAELLRVLFFASEIAVLGSLCVFFSVNGRPRFSEAMNVVLLGGLIGLCITTFFNCAVNRRLALIGFLTIIAFGLWLQACPSVAD